MKLMHMITIGKGLLSCHLTASCFVRIRVRVRVRVMVRVRVRVRVRVKAT